MPMLIGGTFFRVTLLGLTRRLWLCSAGYLEPAASFVCSRRACPSTYPAEFCLSRKLHGDATSSTASIQPQFSAPHISTKPL